MVCHTDEVKGETKTIEVRLSVNFDRKKMYPLFDTTHVSSPHASVGLAVENLKHFLFFQRVTSNFNWFLLRRKLEVLSLLSRRECKGAKRSRAEGPLGRSPPAPKAQGAKRPRECTQCQSTNDEPSKTRRHSCIRFKVESFNEEGHRTMTSQLQTPTPSCPNSNAWTTHH